MCKKIVINKKIRRYCYEKTVVYITTLFLLANGICFAGNTKKENKTMTNKKIVQTAGRNSLGSFAPEFAHFNDDVLFGENWNNKDLSLKTRSLITVIALMAQGITDSSLKYHLQNAKNNGVTKEEIAAAITHTAFYAGWPKAWATFNLAKEVWNDATIVSTEKEKYAQTIMFPIGEPNTAYAKYFIGKSYLQPLNNEQVNIANVTFEPKCRNNWHIHHKSGQILMCVEGRGWYQEWGKTARELHPGDVVNIPSEVKHWHGAAKDSWFTHIAMSVPVEGASTEWLEQVSDEEYNKLP